MNFILDIFAKPVSYVLKGFMAISNNNFVIAVFLLTLIMNLLMLPLSIKTQRSTSKQQMLKPKLDALKKKYGDNMSQQDKMQYQQEMQDLYKKENVSMSGGCLPMVIRLVIMMAVYRVVQSPLSFVVGLKTATIEKLAKAVSLKTTGYYEMQLMSKLTETTKGMTTAIWNQIQSVNFKFFGIDLLATPKFTFNFAELTKSQLALWLIPLLAFGSQMLTSIISLRITKKVNPDQPTMTGMMLTMPLITIFFAFSLPAAVGVYWAFSSLISGGIQAIIQIMYSPNNVVAREQAKFVMKRAEEEKLQLK